MDQIFGEIGKAQQRLPALAGAEKLTGATQPEIFAGGMKVEIEDISEKIASLALQGPTSGRLLASVVGISSETGARRTAASLNAIHESRAHLIRAGNFATPAAIVLSPRVGWLSER